MPIVEGAPLSKILSRAAERPGRCGVSTAIWVIGTDGVQLGEKEGEIKKRRHSGGPAPPVAQQRLPAGPLGSLPSSSTRIAPSPFSGFFFFPLFFFFFPRLLSLCFCCTIKLDRRSLPLQRRRSDPPLPFERRGVVDRHARPPAPCHAGAL